MLIHPYKKEQNHLSWSWKIEEINKHFDLLVYKSYNSNFFIVLFLSRSFMNKTNNINFQAINGYDLQVDQNGSSDRTFSECKRWKKGTFAAVNAVNTDRKWSVFNRIIWRRNTAHNLSASQTDRIWTEYNMLRYP